MNQDHSADTAYSQKSFNDVANNYDQLPLFKLSAQHMLNIVQNTCQDLLQNKRILDVACGTGNVVLEFAKHCPNNDFCGIDISFNMLTKAQQKAQASNLTNIDFQLVDINAFNPPHKFDVITCAYALFFLPQAELILKKLQQKLTSKGVLIFSSFQAHAFKPASDILLNLLRQYQSPSALKFDTHRWQNLLHPADIEHLCQLAKVNLEAIHTHQIGYKMNCDDWWFLFNNTGYKGMLLELNDNDLNELKLDFYQALASLQSKDKHLIDLNADSYFVLVN